MYHLWIDNYYNGRVRYLSIANMDCEIWWTLLYLFHNEWHIWCLDTCNRYDCWSLPSLMKEVISCIATALKAPLIQWLRNENDAGDDKNLMMTLLLVMVMIMHALSGQCFTKLFYLTDGGGLSYLAPNSCNIMMQL